LLAGTLHALLAQVPDTPPYEVIVVDNNSSDATRDIVEPFVGRGIVRYEFEPRQGLSVARNHGVSIARADLIAFTDDDIRVSSTWIQSIVRAFNDNSDVEMVGGKVEPAWEEPPPPWLLEVGDAPLALADFGEGAFRITAERGVCLIGANVAVRRRAFERAGGFSIALQRVRDSVGSMEDHDFQVRVLAGGVSALYEPRIVVKALVPRERLMKQYHRAWHRGHGRFYALMRDPSFERTRFGTVLGVPAHVYRSVLREAAAWGASLLTCRSAAAFAHELRLRFLVGFAVQRIQQRT
jgi:cellulose synthase/poly-beta-1,6-N-acetylglucosamine synthase-like glycosyltransferase